MLRALFVASLLFAAGSPLAAEEDWLSPGVGGLRSSVQAQGAILDLMRASVVNVKSCTGSQMFCASGSAQTTTGSISSGSTSLTVASAIDFAVGQGISVYQAGPANALLVAKITAISGTTVTLDTAASVTRSAVAVAHDDTAGIQAAINATASPGGPTFLPPGTYRISGTGLTLRSGTWLLGSGHGNNSSNDVTTIDATGMGSGVGTAIMSTVGVAAGVRIQGFLLRGLATSNSVTGITAGGTMVEVADVYVFGFYTAITVQGQRSQVNRCLTNMQWRWGLNVASSSSIAVNDSVFANGNSALSAGFGGSITVDGSSDVSLRVQDVDESAAGGRSIYVNNSNRVLIEGPMIYATTTYSGGGYGIQVAGSSTEVTIRNVHTKPFYGPSFGSVYQISLAGTNHRLENVITEPGVGGDISDTSTGTTWWNVNGIYKLPNLRTTDPGAGSKQLWADPADSYRVKLAN